MATTVLGSRASSGVNRPDSRFSRTRITLAALQVAGLLSLDSAASGAAKAATLENHSFRGGQLLQTPDQVQGAQQFPINTFVPQHHSSGLDPLRPLATAAVSIPSHSVSTIQALDFAYLSIGEPSPAMAWSDPRQILRTDTSTLRVDVYSSTNAVKSAIANNTGGDVYSHRYTGPVIGAILESWGGAKLKAFNNNYIPFHKISNLALPEFPVIEGGRTGRQLFFQISIEPKTAEYTELNLMPLDGPLPLVDFFGTSNIRPVSSTRIFGASTTYALEVRGSLAFSDPFTVSISKQSEGGLKFSWPASAGPNYQLQAKSADLLAAKDPGWTNVEWGAPALDGDNFTVVIPTSKDPSMLFRLIPRD